jgi:hypothetical protein
VIFGVLSYAEICFIFAEWISVNARYWRSRKMQ